MTRQFEEDGRSVPVTVIEAGPCVITQVKNEENEGYSAVQMGYGVKKPKNTPLPMQGHFRKAGSEPLRTVIEFRVEEGHEYKMGDTLGVSLLSETEMVDVTGTSKGKGFAGTVKRHNFRMQDATHGNSLAHRAPGSIGQNQTPGRVFKGKKMSGQMGNVRRTVQNLEVVRIDSERNLLLIKGAVPGHSGGKVIVRPAVKATNTGAAS